MFSDYFYFNDELRWNLFFAQPNEAGIFIATLIPFFWFWGRLLRREGILFYLISLFGLMSEFFLWFLLFKTYSRGALVSLMGTAFIFFIIQYFLHPKEKKTIDLLGCDKVEKSHHIFKVIGIGFLLFSSGFFDRIEPQYIANDRSALNRIEIWKGGAGLIANRPIVGWGTERSGEMFNHWFQNPRTESDVNSLINSYLTFGAEYGLIALGGVISMGMIFILGGIAMGIRMRKKNQGKWMDAVFFSCSACLMVFAIGNIFSTLYRDDTLWIIPVSVGFFLLFMLFFESRIRFKLITFISLSMGAALTLCLILFSIGKTLARDNFYQIEKHPFHIELNHMGNGKSAYVMPDPRVLGRVYGKQIRKLAPHYHHLYIEWIDYTSRPIFPVEKTFDEILVFGSQHSQYERFAKDSTIPAILIHPIGNPNLRDSSNIQKLILPEIDISGGSDQLWKKWAIEKEIPFFHSKNTGTDIHLDWPEVLHRLSKKTIDHIPGNTL